MSELKSNQKTLVFVFALFLIASLNESERERVTKCMTKNLNDDRQEITQTQPDNLLIASIYTQTDSFISSNITQ